MSKVTQPMRPKWHWDLKPVNLAAEKQWKV